MDDILDHPALDDREESVRIAVRALGDMRNSVHASPSTSFQTTPALTIASRSSSPSILEEDSPDFVSRVSHFPIVNSALRVYEQGKASSRVVKYGAEMMESSVKTISRPVIDRLPVNQLDEFACRQLDRFGGYSRRRSSPDSSRERSRQQREQSPAQAGRGWTSALREMSISRGRPREDAADGYRNRDEDVSMTRDDGRPPSRSMEMGSRTPTPRQEDASRENQQQVVPRSRWQAVLLEAGGIGAAVSEESMRRLKYCLQWLQYATNQIDQQILRLRDFITSLQNATSASPDSLGAGGAPALEEQLQVLTAIRRDVVDTIRQVVDVVSKYAGGALPEPARARVRTFILGLPQRWQHAAATNIVPNGAVNANANVNGAEAKNGRGRGRTQPYSYGPGEPGPSPRSRPASRASSPRAHRHGRQNGNGAATTGTGAATQAAQKILTLATESIDMLRAVTAVFKESLDKADAWVERLRIVGLQRQHSNLSSPQPTLPPPSALEYREPLPPIPILTPGSSRAHSPDASLTLPPLDPSLYPGPPSAHHRMHHHNHHHPHGHSVGESGVQLPPIYASASAERGETGREEMGALTLSSGGAYSVGRDERGGVKRQRSYEDGAEVGGAVKMDVDVDA